MGISMDTETTGVTRRGFLKRAQALALLAAAGTQLGISSANADERAVITVANPSFDKDVRVINTHHRIHCHGSCMLKAYVKNGRLVRLASMGDVPREGSQKADEDILHGQRRACPRGLSEKKRLYSPDRLKYPMKQTLERGNPAGFVRISWQEAASTVGKWLNEMKEREKTLGYMPVWVSGDSPAQYMGITLGTYGHHSAGNEMDAMHAVIGPKVQGNTPRDVLNSKLIIIWSTDTRTTQPQHTFLLTKAKEAGIPIVVVDTRYTDTAASFATGVGKVPGWIPVRPGTDAAMLSAMAYVIYKKKLFNEKFIKEYCFGFYPNDKTISDSPAKNPVTGEAYKGKTFITPKGCSFVEYLNDLEKEHKGSKGVLKWASSLTGAAPDVIEALAIEYASSPSAAFFCGWTTGGAQRTNGGLYYTWLLIGLAAMTGNIGKRGGGFGMVCPHEGYKISLGKAPAVTDKKKYKQILFSTFFSSEVITSGRDKRSAEELRDDVKRMNGIDLGDDPRLKIEMIYRGAGSVDIFNQRASINKKTEAWKKVKYIVSYEFHMSSTAKYSDIVLPATMNFEQSFFTNGQMNGELDVANKVSEPLYECKTDAEINSLIAKEVGMEFKVYSDTEIMEAQWSGAAIPEKYKQINPDIKLPTLAEMMTNAECRLVVPLDKTWVDTASYKPGQFNTDTGKINFYSPFLAERKRVQSGVCRAQYVRPAEGYEDILEGKKSAKGVKYGLQFITPHVIHRSHTSFDTVQLLKETFEDVVEINVADAAKRGIKDGQTVYVYNDSGCIKLPAKVTKRIMPGVVALYEGKWYSPDYDDMYEAMLDMDGSGKLKPVKVPVDKGANVSVITTDIESGAGDPFINAVTNKSGGFAAGGMLCEVSAQKLA